MSSLEIVEVVGVIIFFIIAIFIWVRYDMRQYKKFIESIPPIGERYKVIKQEYKGKTYFVLCGVIIYKKIREINTYFIKSYENEEEALEGANILNKKDIEEQELKEMKKYFENNI